MDSGGAGFGEANKRRIKLTAVQQPMTILPRTSVSSRKSHASGIRTKIMPSITRPRVPMISVIQSTVRYKGQL
jgi:hypothetical protein